MRQSDRWRQLSSLCYPQALKSALFPHPSSPTAVFSFHIPPLPSALRVWRPAPLHKNTPRISPQQSSVPISSSTFLTPLRPAHCAHPDTTDQPVILRDASPLRPANTSHWLAKLHLCCVLPGRTVIARARWPVCSVPLAHILPPMGRQLAHPVQSEPRSLEWAPLPVRLVMSPPRMPQQVFPLSVSQAHLKKIR